MYIYILNSVINVLFPFGTDRTSNNNTKGAGQRKQGGVREEGGRQKG